MLKQTCATVQKIKTKANKDWSIVQNKWMWFITDGSITNCSSLYTAIVIYLESHNVLVLQKSDIVNRLWRVSENSPTWLIITLHLYSQRFYALDSHVFLLFIFFFLINDVCAWYTFKSSLCTRHVRNWDEFGHVTRRYYCRWIECLLKCTSEEHQRSKKMRPRFLILLRGNNVRDVTE